MQISLNILSARLSKPNTKLKPRAKNSNILHLTNVIRLKLNMNDEKQMWTVDIEQVVVNAISTI